MQRLAPIDDNDGDNDDDEDNNFNNNNNNSNSLFHSGQSYRLKWVHKTCKVYFLNRFK